MDDATHHDAGHGPAGDDEAVNAASGRAGLLLQLRQLEDFAERTVSEGGSLPPQATAMILHLREIVEALDGLAASMGEEVPLTGDADLAREHTRGSDLRESAP